MKPLALLTFLLACGSALADGVPLVTPGTTAPTGAAIQRAAKEPTFVKAHAITFNKFALGSNVLTVVINGKEHRFVGQAIPKAAPGRIKQADITSWVGTEGGLAGGTLSLARDADTGYMSALVSLEGRVFEIKPMDGAFVMIESDPAFRLAPTTPPVPPARPASGSGK